MPDRLINKRTDKLKTQLIVEKHDPLKFIFIISIIVNIPYDLGYTGTSLG
jgi:hypothetical protein